MLLAILLYKEKVIYTLRCLSIKFQFINKMFMKCFEEFPFQSFLRFVKLDSICPLVHVWLKLLGMLLNAHSLPLPQMTYWEFYDHEPSDSHHFWWGSKN